MSKKREGELPDKLMNIGEYYSSKPSRTDRECQRYRFGDLSIGTFCTKLQERCLLGVSISHQPTNSKLGVRTTR